MSVFASSPENDLGPSQHDDEEQAEATPHDSLLGHRTARGQDNKRLLLTAGPGLLLCAFAVGFDLSFLASNYSGIASSLNRLNDAVWIILLGSISESACQPLYGHISNIYGRRFAVLLAATAMITGLLLCSVSQNLWQLALSRVVVGLGSSGLQLLVIIVINDLVPLYDLPLWRSIVIIVETIALMLGGPIGSLLIDAVDWRLAFAVEFAMMFLAIVVLYFTLNLPEGRGLDHSEKKIDVLGTLALFAAVGVPLFAINIGGNMLPWDHPGEIALLCTAPLAVAFFFFVEARANANPIIPTRLIRIPAVAKVLMCSFCVVFAYNQLVYNFGLYVGARSFNHESRFNGWALPCMFFGRPIGSALSGLWIRKYNVYKSLLIAALTAAIAIYFFFTAGLIEAENPAYWPILIATGLIIGVTESCIILALLSAVAKEDQPTLYALFDLVLSVAGDAGIAASSALTRAFLISSLSGLPGTIPNRDEVIRKSLRSLDYIRKLPSDLREPIVRSIISSIEKDFGVSFMVCILGVIVSIYMQDTSGA